MGLPGMPEDKLPPCWSDDVRMNALFAPFRIKTANPESWDMKMKFWSDMLRQWCKCKKDPIVSAADAKFAFQRKGRTPACIDIVVEEMCRSGELSPLSKYQQILHSGPEGWVRWGARIAFRPAAFALTAVSSLLPARQTVDNDGLPKASIDATQRWVLESAIKEQATDLLRSWPPDADRIGTVEELMRGAAWRGGRELFELLLGYLVSQGGAVKKDDVVKLAESDKKVTPVTASDEALAQLTACAARLEAELARLARDRAAAHAAAAHATRLGDRLAAKAHLRRKLKVSARADRCEQTLDNVRQLLQQARDADVTAAVVSTYKTTSEAMKRGMQEHGLNEDAVHDTMDDLKEMMDTYNEVERALANTPEDEDTQQLEDELNELLARPATADTPRDQKEAKPSEKPRKVSEREFVFDGEARILAELNDLDVEDGAPQPRAEPERPQPEKSTSKQQKPSQAWYPPSGQSLREETWSNNNLDASLAKLAQGCEELRQDDRIHPGQPLSVDFTTPPRLYGSQFQVRDHKPCGGVWLYNDSGDADQLAASTEYFSSESPGKSGAQTFQMAPGGERKNQHREWNQQSDPVDDLERRLQNLRGFKL